jgi:hypothetical protein
MYLFFNFIKWKMIHSITNLESIYLLCKIKYVLYIAHVIFKNTINVVSNKIKYILMKSSQIEKYNLPNLYNIYIIGYKIKILY